MIRNITKIILIVSAVSLALFDGSAAAAGYTFPIIGETTFYNDFYAPRSNGSHFATDIIADKHSPIVSRTDGIVTYLSYPQPSWGYGVFVQGTNGKTYNYIHLNNDTPGTDNGGGGAMFAYGPDIEPGREVKRGQLLGYVGDSGNAEETVSHLHFEIYDGPTPINPYNGLTNNSDIITKPDYNYPTIDGEFLPVGTSFRGGVSLAMGDVDGDGEAEIVTGSGEGGRYLKVFEQDGTTIGSFTPNGPEFFGGVDVATGDIDGDGTDEIITAAGVGGKYIKIFDLDGTVRGRFIGSSDDTREGMNVSAGDIDGDGVVEIVSADAQNGGTVRTFEVDGTLTGDFTPYGTFNKGVNLSVGDVEGDLAEEIVTGPRKGGGPRVSIFTADGTRTQTYYAYGSAFKGGIEVEVSNVDALDKAEILTLPEVGGTPRVKVFAGTGTALDYSDYFAETWWRGTYGLAAYDSLVITSLGVDRRTSVRQATGYLD